MIYITLFMLVLSCQSQYDFETDIANDGGRRNMFISLDGDEECIRFDSWAISGSSNLNHMTENPTQHTFGIKVDNTDFGDTNCDILLGVFTFGGSFGCVIEGGVQKGQITYCNSY